MFKKFSAFAIVLLMVLMMIPSYSEADIISNPRLDLADGSIVLSYDDVLDTYQIGASAAQ